MDPAHASGMANIIPVRTSEFRATDDVHAFFERAREAAPALVFIDELDGIGGRRGTGYSYKDEVLTALLQELDGAGESGNVAIIAATNRPDMLDPALLRAGRLADVELVDLPNTNARRAILQIQMRGKRFVSGRNAPDLEDLTSKTDQFSPADIKRLVEEAGLVARARRAKAIARQDFDEALERIGPSVREDDVALYRRAANRGELTVGFRP